MSAYIGHTLVVGGGAAQAAGWEWIRSTPAGLVGLFQDIQESDGSPMRGACAFQRGDNLWVIGGQHVGTNAYSATWHMYSFDRGSAPSMSASAVDVSRQLRVPRAWHSCVVHDGALWVVGGVNAQGPVTTVERIPLPVAGDPTLATGMDVGCLSPRVAHNAYLQGDRLYVMGGEDTQGAAVPTIDVLRLTGNSATLIEQRTLGSASLWKSGAAAVAAGRVVLLAGGETSGVETDSVRLLTMGANGPSDIVTGIPVVGARSRALAVRLFDRICVLGGEVGGSPVATGTCLPLGAPVP